MSKGHHKSKLQIAVDRAWKFYEKWRGHEPITPAFKERVHATRLGWDHIINPRHRRSKADKIRQLDALPLAKKLLTLATTYQEYRYADGFHYYALQAEMDGKRIKVIVSSKKKSGKKYFLSVIILR